MHRVGMRMLVMMSLVRVVMTNQIDVNVRLSVVVPIRTVAMAVADGGKLPQQHDRHKK